MIAPNKPDNGPPADRSAEQALVGALILKPAAMDDLGILRPEDFYHDDLRQLFAALVDARRRGLPIDETLLRRQFAGDDWAARIFEIVGSATVHVQHYARLIADLARRRRLREIGAALVEAAEGREGTPEEILDRAENDLAAIHAVKDAHEPMALADAAVEAITRIDAIAERGSGSGLPTGLVTFDSDMGGLFPGELTILAARPGVGKTSLALQIAEHNAARGRLIYFASLEMSAVELSIRMACAESGVSNRLVRIGQLTAHHTAALSQAFNSQSKANLEIHDRASLTIAAIRREIRKRKKRGLALAVVDYLQLIQPEDRKVPREQQVAGMVRSLKETAREYEIPILCLCQLNRQTDADETPRLHHLRESGAIEQDADVVLFLSRHKPTDDEPHSAVLSVAKNRNGETGHLRLEWDGPRTRFSCFGFNEEFAEWSA